MELELDVRDKGDASERVVVSCRVGHMICLIALSRTALLARGLTETSVDLEAALIDLGATLKPAA